MKVKHDLSAKFYSSLSWFLVSFEKLQQFVSEQFAYMIGCLSIVWC